MANIEKLKDIECFKNQDLYNAIDNLTRLLNKDIALEYVNYLIENKKQFTMAIIDLDNFKHINDTFGHMIGDKVLNVFSECLSNHIGSKGICGRYGGDEFIVVLEGIYDYNDIWKIFHDLNGEIALIKLQDLDKLFITTTTGITRYPIDGDNVDTLISTAEKALYRGKMKGRNCFIIYLKEKHENIKIEKINDATLSTMTMLAQVFDYLNADNTLDVNINNLFKRLSSYFMFDHISIQSNDALVTSIVHSLSIQKEYKYIDTKEYRKNMNEYGILFINNIRTLLLTSNVILHKRMYDQQILSSLVVDIKYNDTSYGLLRIDMCNPRTWSAQEVDIATTAARLIAVLIAKLDTNLNELFNVVIKEED
ncbi:MAG: GGDEF domain-containing protein [Acholeplasmatales bacterium]|nr:GGDEF domain-containing protein [Acholeplasmatales bacterium]